MSYIKSYPVRASGDVRRGQVVLVPVRSLADSLGGIWELVTGVSTAADDNAEQLKCIDQANNSADAKTIDALMASLAQTWNPTGLYTGKDITRLMDVLSTLTTEARANLLPLPSNSWGITTARNYLDINDTRIAAYRAAVAASGGRKIPAPDLKKEYLKSLVNVWNAIVTVQVVTCRLTTGQRFAQLLQRAYDAAKAVLGEVLDFAEKAAGAIKAPLNIIGWLGDHPYVPVGIAAVILYKHFAK